MKRGAELDMVACLFADLYFIRTHGSGRHIYGMGAEITAQES